MVELGVAMVWFDFDFDFVGCRGCWSLWLGFQENNSLGMFFVVVVVVASGCIGDLGFGFLFLFGF